MLVSPFVLLVGLALHPLALAPADDAKNVAVHLEWSQGPPLPDANGLAATFAGVHANGLIVAGGANFPDLMPWQGGKKVWHDRVWILDNPEAQWREAGRLPTPLAYGISIGTPDGVLCIGGSRAAGHSSAVFRLAWRNGKLETTTLPPLPTPIANASGGMLGTTILVAGGTTSPEATRALKTFLALDLAENPPRWRELEPWRGPARMLAVAAVLEGKFYLIGGTDLYADEQGKPTRRYLRDAHAFHPTDGWKQLADLPNPTVAAPSPAPTWGKSHILIVGGDDGSNVGFLPPERHPGFNKTVLMYDVENDAWIRVGETPAPRVTVPAVEWKKRWWIISGETRPGVRSPEAWRLGLHSP